MNISETEAPIRLVAKISASREKNKSKVVYEFIDSYHSLCLDKKDIIYAQLEAYDRLLEYVSDEQDKRTVESEIVELKMAMDPMA
jgi:hypothetical protein